MVGKYLHSTGKVFANYWLSPWNVLEKSGLMKVLEEYWQCNVPGKYHPIPKDWLEENLFELVGILGYCCKTV